MSGVKHTPVSVVHPDNTALRAVDACGGTYTAADEASGWADGHRAALDSAMVAVGRADSITAALLEALKGLLDIEDARIMTGAFRPNADGKAVIDAARAAIARARGEQSQSEKEVGNG